MSQSLVNTVLELVQPEGSCKVDMFVCELVASIQKSLMTQTNWQEKKFHADFIKWIATLIENVFKNAKALKINKKDILLEIMIKLFGKLSEQDIKTISNNLENIHSTKQIIKVSKSVIKRSFNKLFKKKVIGWLAHFITSQSIQSILTPILCKHGVHPIVILLIFVLI